LVEFVPHSKETWPEAGAKKKEKKGGLQWGGTGKSSEIWLRRLPTGGRGKKSRKGKKVKIFKQTVALTFGGGQSYNPQTPAPSKKNARFWADTIFEKVREGPTHPSSEIVPGREIKALKVMTFTQSIKGGGSRVILSYLFPKRYNPKGAEAISYLSSFWRRSKMDDLGVQCIESVNLTLI